MKKISRIVISFLAFGTMFASYPAFATAADINIIPVPVKTQLTKGEFVLPRKIVVSYQISVDKNQAADGKHQISDGKHIAQYLADKLKASTGYDVMLSDKKGNVAIQISPSLKDSPRRFLWYAEFYAVASCPSGKPH